MIFLAFNILTSGVPLSMVCAVIALAAAFFLIAAVVRSPAGNQRMREISAAIQEGAKAYLNRQVITISSIAIIIFILLFIFKDKPTAIGFVIGAFCSLSAGFIGMRIAVVANVRTTQAATESITKALRVAFNGGAVTGLLVVGLALLSVSIFYSIVARMLGPHMAVSSLVGLALGASLISVFARLGGGIYTKAADVGADLVGKIEKGLEEDDPRNAATIADNVGDNVGDCAGMAADILESYKVTLVAALILGFTAYGGTGNLRGAAIGVMFPLFVRAIGVVTSIVGIYMVNPRTETESGMKSINRGFVTSAVLSALATFGLTYLYFRPEGEVDLAPAWAVLIGLVLAGVIHYLTEYYTAIE